MLCLLKRALWKMMCRKGMLKALAYDWKLNRTIEYISRSWSFLLIFLFVLRFVLHKAKNAYKQSNHSYSKMLVQWISWMNNSDYRVIIEWISAMRTIKCLKGIWWMPWHAQAMKDVIRCDKLRGGANTLWSVDFRMGQPTFEKRYLHLNKIGCKKQTQGTETSKYL